MAGAGYKLFVTGDVLTAAQVNTYLQEQTVMSFADAAARTSALSAVLSEGMMSYLRDTNAVQVYNGSAWVAVGSSSPLTTKGDLYGFNTADARIPIGTNNQVLTADSAQALGLKWATPVTGGMTLLSTTVPTATSSTVTISSISGSYTHLMVVALGIRSNNGANTDGVSVRFNNVSTAANYVYAGAPATSLSHAFYIRGNTAQAANVMMVYNYAQATYVKPVYGQGMAGDAAGGSLSGQQSWGYFNNTAAINEVNLILSATTFQATGAIYVYGVN